MADPKALGTLWLRDRARILRTAANDAENAYSSASKLGHVCAKVAKAYREAAALLDDHATRLEDDHG